MTGTKARRHEGTQGSAVELCYGEAVRFSLEHGNPCELLISPSGLVPSKNNPFILDKESWALIEKDFRESEQAIIVDLDHESLRTDGLAPKDRIGAVGWIEDLRFDEAVGLFAIVQWNEEGLTRVRADRWRYLSPAFKVGQDRKVFGLDSLGLVNKPAIPRLRRVKVNEFEEQENDSMDLQKELQSTLGAAETDTPEMLLNAVGDLLKKADAAEAAAGTVKAACKALGLKEDANETEVLVAINSQKQNATTADATKTELAALKDKIVTMEATKLVDAAIAAHKVNPNAKEDLALCTQLAKEKPEAFAKLMAERTPLVDLGRTNPPEGGATGGEKGRETIIANAQREFSTDPKIGKVTSLPAFVNFKLQDAQLTVLSEDERKKIGG